jgi:hypothetical protein
MEQTLQACNFKEITNNNIKNNIISLIYQELTINNFRYQLLDSKNIDSLKKEIFYITPHIVGTNCWIIYYEGPNMPRNQYIIYKKDLKSFKNQIELRNFKMYTFNFINKLANNLYPLTIFEGKIITNNFMKPTFLIQDMFIYNGIQVLTKNLPDKIKLIEGLLPSLNDGLEQNFIIKLSGIYTYEQIGDLIFNKIKKSQMKINGIIFLPEKSGRTFLYINDSEFNQLRNNVPSEYVCKEYSSLSVPSIPLQMSHKMQLDNHLINDFVLRRTNIADVFEIYKYEFKEKIFLNLTKDRYVGICHIPDIKTSHYCKTMGDTNEIFVNKCNYNYKFKKWSPIIN